MKETNVLILISLSCLLLFPFCKKDEVMEADCRDFHWGYDGEGSPEHWVTCYTDCGGDSQSPVDITGATAGSGLQALDLHYEEVPIQLINNGHTIEFEYEQGSLIRFNETEYDLLQFHFHTRSEHTVAGKSYPMEAHLVHKNEASGNLLVIGIFFEEGSENTFLQNFIDHLPPVKDDHYSSMTEVNVEHLLPTQPGYYMYSGSLTTPPCSENVAWFVMKSPVQASSAQVQKMHDIIHSNYRPVQPLNGRQIIGFSFGLFNNIFAVRH